MFILHLQAWHPFFGGPLEASHYAVLGLAEVLHTLGDVGEDVEVDAGRPKAPDLAGLSYVPFLLSASYWVPAGVPGGQTPCSC